MKLQRASVPTETESYNLNIETVQELGIDSLLLGEQSTFMNGERNEMAKLNVPLFHEPVPVGLSSAVFWSFLCHYSIDASCGFPWCYSIPLLYSPAQAAAVDQDDLWHPQKWICTDQCEQAHIRGSGSAAHR